MTKRKIGNIRGPQGATGPQGPEGPQGPQGEKGDKGDPGSGGSVYAICDTAFFTAANEATIVSGTLELVEGAQVTVKFTYGSIGSNQTLNVGGTGAKPIYWRGEAVTTEQSPGKGSVVSFIYDGTNWEIVGVAKDNNTVENTVYQSVLPQEMLELDGYTESKVPLLMGDPYNMEFPVADDYNQKHPIAFTNDIYANPYTGTVTSKYQELTETPTADNHAVTKGYVDGKTTIVWTKLYDNSSFGTVKSVDIDFSGFNFVLVQCYEYRSGLTFSNTIIDLDCEDCMLMDGSTQGWASNLSSFIYDSTGMYIRAIYAVIDSTKSNISLSSGATVNINSDCTIGSFTRHTTASSIPLIIYKIYGGVYSGV